MFVLITYNYYDKKTLDFGFSGKLSSKSEENELLEIGEELKKEGIEVKIEEIKDELNDVVAGCSCGGTGCGGGCGSGGCGGCSCRVYSKSDDLGDDNLKVA